MRYDVRAAASDWLAVVRSGPFDIVNRVFAQSVCSGAGHLCLRCAYDECSSGVGTIVAVPGGMVRCLEGYCE